MTGAWTGWTGGGRAAVLIALLLPAGCMSSFTLGRPPGGGGGDTGSVDSGGDSPPGADRDGSSDRDGNCPAGSSFSQFQQVHRITPSLVIALDHSSSMSMSRFGNNNGTRLSVVQSTLEDRLAKYAQIIRFGYVEFPGVAQGHSCSNMNGCCVGKVSPPVNGSEVGIINAIDQCGAGQSASSGCLNSDATPTAQALSAVEETYGGLGGADAGGTSSNPLRYTLLITDGEPSCPVMGMPSGDLCGQASAEVARLNSMGILTYVIGVGEIMGFADMQTGANVCLNDLALAGGASRGSKSPFYYPAMNEGAFDSALDLIVTQTACHVEVDETTDPDQTRIEVVSNNNNSSGPVTIPRDPTAINGWAYERNSDTKIAFYGAACTTFLSTVQSNNQKIRGDGCLAR
jgi:hypothetical protein